MRILYVIMVALPCVVDANEHPAYSQSTSEYPIKDVVCQPLPYARTPEEAEAQKARLENLAVCPAEQYPARPEYPVADVRCRPLPPSGNAEVAKIWADRLQDTRVCPLGQYPVRFGSGKDLDEQRQSCKVMDKRLRDLEWRWAYGPMETDPVLARSSAEMLARVDPCPYDQQVEYHLPPGAHEPPPASPFSDGAQPPSGAISR